MDKTYACELSQAGRPNRMSYAGHMHACLSGDVTNVNNYVSFSSFYGAQIFTLCFMKR